MGTDIHGVIECRPEFTFGPDEDDAWEWAIDLSLLYTGRDYDLFGCLFGVQNFAGFVPVAAGRGLPTDVAPRTRDAVEQFGNEAHSASWLNGNDLAAIDWSESAIRADSRIHRYVRATEDTWVYDSKAGQDREWADATGHRLDQDGSEFPEGTEWLVDDRLYRVERLCRRDAIGDEWLPVFEVMRVLVRLHGSNNVRLVVWFDA
ncbi:hypothetical protein [Actinopolymorpha alba]|uniref:hypothetical protein n=1 Tax=Actinopolymorpha alba TaxID=533267 RepID=UPI00036894CA|nr:hypothetical protein [Actinopolymorpha alba]